MKVQICSPRIYCCAFFLIAIVALSITIAHSEAKPDPDTPATARMRILNNSLLTLHGRMQQANVISAQNLRSQAATVIAQRAAALGNLIQTSPNDALRFAFSPELLADLATKFPQSASQLESRTTVNGPVQHWIADYPKSSRSIWQMNVDGRNLNLYFAGPEPGTLNIREQLQVTGIVTGSLMAVESSAIIQPSTSAVTTSSRLVATDFSDDIKHWPAVLFLTCELALFFRSSESEYSGCKCAVMSSNL